MSSSYRRLVSAIGASLGIIITVVAAGLPLYVFPATEDPTHADVVFVLGTPTRAKVQIAQELVSSGHADRILISVPRWGRWAAHNMTVCTARLTYPVDCETPDPFTTQGEARMLRAYADDHDVTSAVVVTSVAHVTRARILMQRCFDGALYFRDDGVPRDLTYWIEQYAYQTGAFVKAAFDGC
jgi:hypothetical protein